VRDTPSVAAGYGRRSTRSVTLHAPCGPLCLWTSASSGRPGPHLSQRPKICSTACPGGLGKRTPRVSATDFEEACRIQANANRAQRRAREQCQEVPPCARDLRLEFQEVGLPTFNSPRLTCAALARLQQANPSPRGQHSHGLRPGRHNSGGGEEHNIQVYGIYVEPALAQSIQSTCA
jgi:hypothetical protein